MASDQAAEPPLKTYHGNCHCGAVRYTVQTPSLEDGSPVYTCDCSICIRRGALFIYAKPSTNTSITFTRGKDHLKDYLYGDKMIAHQFCPTCGINTSAHSDEYKMTAINVRTFQDIDVDKLRLKYLTTAKDYPPAYKLDP